MSTKIYDAIIVGGGLSGLSMAAGLSQNQKVALVEAGEFAGGMCRPHTGYKDLTGHFHTIPFSAESEKTLDFLEVLLHQPIRREKVEQQPVTFEDGLKPFLGYGDQQPPFVEELDFYTSQQRLHLYEGPDYWVHVLFEKFKGEFFNFSQVTKILFENQKAVGVVVNGQKILQANNIIFCGDPKSLLQLTGNEDLPAKIRQKLTKSQLWTSILLQFVHEQPISENLAIHILNQKSDLNSYCIGQFQNLPLENGHNHQSSQWLTFMAESDSEDEELLAQAIKRTKKLITKAYPNAFENLKYEKISVCPHSHGQINISLADDQSLPGVENLYLVNSLTGNLKNVAGSLEQAERCLKSLGFCAAP